MIPHDADAADENDSPPDCEIPLRASLEQAINTLHSLLSLAKFETECLGGRRAAGEAAAE